MSLEDVVKRRLKKQQEEGQRDLVEKLNARVEELEKNPSKQEEQKSGLQIFQGGGFSGFDIGAKFRDGYQFGDVAKTGLDLAKAAGKTYAATVGDVWTSAARGLGGVSEGIGDALTYITAGIMDATDGTDKKGAADRLRKATQKNVVGDLLTVDAIDKNSLLGSTSKAILEGVGQGVATQSAAGLGGPLLSGAMMFASGLGNNMTEAYQGGATDGEAAIYGLATGAWDAITETLSGGLGKGAKALGVSIGIGGIDDMIASGLTKNIKNKVIANLIQGGVKGVGEGLEELLSYGGQVVAKKLTYLSEKDWAELWNNQEALENFVVGMMSSAIMQAPDVVKASQAGRDFVTGRTDAEQTVIDKVYKDRVAEQEKGGKKLTTKEKGQILDAVEQAYERGEIAVEDIEAALGGETYRKYTEATKQQEAMQAEFDKLNGMKKSDMTGAQEDRLQELRQQLEAMKTENAAGKLQLQYQQEARAKAGGGQLMESYNQREQRRQAFQADLGSYDAKQRAIVQKAIDSGILNNTRKSHEFVDLVAKIGAETGTDFDFTNSKKLRESGFAVEGVTVNGFTDGKTVTVNINSAKALNTVVGHEIMHVLEGTELAGKLQEQLFAYAKKKGEFNKRRADLETLYAGRDADIDRELAADLVGDYLFTDIDFVRNLKAGNRNLFQRVFDEIKHLVKLATAGSKEARELEKVKKLFEDVYREAGTEKSTAKDGGVKYSLVGRTAEGFGIYKTNYPLNTPKKVKQAEIISLIQNVWSNNPIKLTIVENGEYADITAKFNPELGERSDLAKIAFGNRKGNGQEKRMTLDLGSDLYQIAEEAKFSYSKEAIPKPNNPAHDGVTKYHYFVTNIVYKDNDGNYVPCHMNIDVKRNEEGDWFYSFAIEKGSVPQALLAAGTDNSATLPSGIVTDPEENVNLKLTTSSDNEYLKLVNQGNTKAAQKLVDAAAKEAGYTIKAYHGTDAGEFHEFDKGRIGEASGLSILGDGFYFSDRESTARQYGKNVFPVYLKQLNPYNATAADAYKLNALELERQGYDSVILQTGKGKVLMVLDPNQVKSAEPITYDDKGNVIPLSERFNPKSNDMRYSLSPEADRAYMDAVENDNIEAAQVMVDEAANEAGFTVSGHHGTYAMFNEFSPDFLGRHGLAFGPGFYFSTRRATAKSYEEKGGRIIDAYLKAEKSLSPDEKTMSFGQMRKFAKALEKASKKQKLGLWGTIELYTGEHNDLDIINELWYKARDNMRHEEFFGILRDTLGYDSVKVDFEGANETFYVVFNADQIKSADPVTYDDEGNVIPLSQRFNPKSKDIRESLSRAGETAGFDDSQIYGRDVALEAPVQKAPVAAQPESKATGMEAPTAAEMPKAQTVEAPVAEEKPVAADMEQRYGDEDLPWTAESVQALEDTSPQRDSIRDVEPDAAQEETQEVSPRKALRNQIMGYIRAEMGKRGFDLDEILNKAKNLSTFATVDNTPQRVMEKAFGYEAGQALADLTVNQAAQHESQGIQWLNQYTDRKNGLLAQISKQYDIKPGSKKSAAAQMYAEGFFVNAKNEIIRYGDAELAADFPDTKVQAQIKGLARDPRVRKIYDNALKAINESRRRNGYPEIPRRSNYFLHFREMSDTFSQLGIPFNPNDIKAKDLPTDLNGVTADLKPGQPFFASQMKREGKRTTFDLLGGIEKYLTQAKNQIYHIDDIQTIRALENYIVDTYGQAKGLENIDQMDPQEAAERIEQIYDIRHLSTFRKFLHEEANALAGKTALIDRGVEGLLGRRALTFLDSVRKQVGSNMVGFNASSALTNTLSIVQGFAKTENKFDFVKAVAQTVQNRLKSITGKQTDGFAENSPVMIRRKGADRFHRTLWQKATDAGFALMSGIDDIATELIARTKYNELTRKGMDPQQAHFETDKWTSRLMGDRSIGQMPQIFNSKALALFTQFQLETRNQLDSMFYDTIQEAKVSSKDIEKGLKRNAAIAAKSALVIAEMAALQHLYGKAFEAVAGYNPTFDIIGTLIKAMGWDDEEDSEDTFGDNLEQGFQSLIDDLPYVGTFTGGRIPIESALPVEELINGTDQYGNEKSRWEILAEALPYYVLPTGFNQAKKTAQGLGMFYTDMEMAGSYTDKGKLRFAVEDTPMSRLQAAVFGQYANPNARAYFDQERMPLGASKIDELNHVDMTMQEYWDYQDALKAAGDKTADKMEVVMGLDLPMEQKNILANNIVDRKDPIDLTGAEDFGSFAEFDFYSQNPEKYKFLNDHGISWNAYTGLSAEEKDAVDKLFNAPKKTEFLLKKGVTAAQWKDMDEEAREELNFEYNNPEKYSFLQKNGISVADYSGFDEATKNAWDTMAKNPKKYEFLKKQGVTVDQYKLFNQGWKDAWNWAYDNQDAYLVSQGVTEDLYTYRRYVDKIKGISGDKNEKGNTISGSKRKKIWAYIQTLPLSDGAKLLLFKQMDPDNDTYDTEIVRYVQSLGMTYAEKKRILEKLGF